ncbi:MAG: hypothetical protein HZB50_08905 [Chloroflexi bacterium]|nr:hypothetical protein [Chloroflexota bacterium]
MKKINWLVVGVIGIIALLFQFGGGMMSGWGLGNYGYHGWGMMRSGGMMGGWLGMAFMWLVPISVITLIVLGVSALVQNSVVLGVSALVQNSGKSTPPSPQTSCPNCAKSVQADWQTCPYCSTALK